MRNLGVALACVVVVNAAMLADFKLCFLVTLCVLLTIVDVAGMCFFLGQVRFVACRSIFLLCLNYLEKGAPWEFLRIRCGNAANFRRLWHCTGTGFPVPLVLHQLRFRVQFLFLETQTVEHSSTVQHPSTERRHDHVRLLRARDRLLRRLLRPHRACVPRQPRQQEGARHGRPHRGQSSQEFRIQPSTE